jgi:hypothetical protein
MNKFKIKREWNEDDILISEEKISTNNSYSYGKSWYDNGNPSRSWIYIKYSNHYEKIYLDWNRDGSRNYMATYKKDILNGFIIIFNYSNDERNAFEKIFPRFMPSDLLDRFFG